MANYLVTGAAGFIGARTSELLIKDGHTVAGVDNLNETYDPRVKEYRLKRLQALPGYVHVQADLADRAAVEEVFAHHRPRRVVHLAAQAGVRYASQNPHAYM